MPRAKVEARTVFVCQACGGRSRKWTGQCPECRDWNTLVEEPEAAAPAAGDDARYGGLAGRAEVRRYSEIDVENAARVPSGFGEFDRVLGGGIVPGSMVLVGGEPGIGKSTLLLQVAARIAAAAGPVLYASGEESEQQVKERGQRLDVGDPDLYLLAETCLERLLEAVDRVRPRLLVVDSIQTIYSLNLASAPGSVGQVREAATHLLFGAKRRNLPTILVGHVTKDGSLAGPKVLEHVVDTVLYFEGERHHSHRVVRAVKNRFGAVSELGVFEMTGAGLVAVSNPSRLFLSDRAAGVPGSVVLCSLEGTRPILVEVQALVSTGAYGTARRMASGIDHNRLSLLLAVLEKRAGLGLAGEDVFVNVAGGLAIDEPAADLGVVAAVASSLRGRGVRPGTAVFGEVGLGGEVRGTPQAGLRVREAAQLGFTRCVMPEVNRGRETADAGCETVGVESVEDALDALLAVS
ncbi:MAG: DNA repair protein RadA [Acidobacteria bacterium]|nr:DNA repair protein RadA [Acidobacteriota bacterium]